MTFLTAIAIASTLCLAAMIPGPGVFAIVARGLASGFSHAALVAIGIVLGDLVFLMLAIFGLSAMAEIMGDFFMIIKYLGGAYLIWLGIKLWRSKPVPMEVKAIKETSWAANFFSGLFITLGNPKTILFYLGLLPTFIDLNAVTSRDIALLVAIVVSVVGCVLFSYAYSASRARGLFKNSRAERLLHRMAGGVLMITGGIVMTRS